MQRKPVLNCGSALAQFSVGVWMKFNMFELEWYKT